MRSCLYGSTTRYERPDRNADSAMLGFTTTSVSIRLWGIGHLQPYTASERHAAYMPLW